MRLWSLHPRYLDWRGPARTSGRIAVSRGQLEYEWQHLQRKLAVRDPDWLAKLGRVARPRPHPLFRVVSGGVADWQRMGLG